MLGTANEQVAGMKQLFVHLRFPFPRQTRFTCGMVDLYPRFALGQAECKLDLYSWFPIEEGKHRCLFVRFVGSVLEKVASDLRHRK